MQFELSERKTAALKVLCKTPGAKGRMVNFTARNSVLSASVSTGDLDATLHIGAPLDWHNSIGLPVEALQRVLANMGGTITGTVDNGMVEFTTDQHSGSVRLQSAAPTEILSPEDPAEFGEVDFEAVLAAVKGVDHATPRTSDSTRAAVQCVVFADGMTQATDLKVYASEPVEFPATASVHTDTLHTVAALGAVVGFEDTEWFIDHRKWFGFRSPEFSVVGAVSQEQFPKTETIVNLAHGPNTATFDREEMMEVVRFCCAVSAEDAASVVILSFIGGLDTVMVERETREVGSTNRTMDCTFDEQGSIGFSSGQLQDMLRSLEGAERVAMKYTDPNKPVAFIDADAPEEFRYGHRARVVMPIRLDARK